MSPPADIGIPRFAPAYRSMRRGNLFACALFEHFARRQIPEQKKKRRAVRQQGYRERYVEENLGKDGSGYQDKSGRQTGGQAISQRDDQPAEENRNWGEQCADLRDAFGGEQRG